MTRRAALPGAAELFRSTSPPRANRDPQANRDSDWVGTSKAPRGQDAEPADGNRLGTGRQKHDSKITVYVSRDELLALEHARLALRATHGLAVDRGRVVREAVAVLLADFDAQGEDSVLVRRLRAELEQ